MVCFSEGKERSCRRLDTPSVDEGLFPMQVVQPWLKMETDLADRFSADSSDSRKHKRQNF